MYQQLLPIANRDDYFMDTSLMEISLLDDVDIFPRASQIPMHTWFGHILIVMQETSEWYWY